ncbi:MAG: hypothetical protein R2793_01915 [Flavobacteriaceae bacterium]
MKKIALLFLVSVFTIVSCEVSDTEIQETTTHLQLTEETPT